MTRRNFFSRLLAAVAVGLGAAKAQAVAQAEPDAACVAEYLVPWKDKELFLRSVLNDEVNFAEVFAAEGGQALIRLYRMT